MVICPDLKVVALTYVLQTEYTRFMCFLCKWESRAKSEHYEYPNVVYRSIVREQIFLPPLHVKLDLMKQFIKSLQQKKVMFAR